MTIVPAASPRRAAWRAGPLAACLAALAALGRSGASYSVSTGTAASVATGALVGADAPAGGSTFSVPPTGSAGCQLTWSALAGGTSIADRCEVTDAGDGTTVTTTAGVTAAPAPSGAGARTGTVSSATARRGAPSAWAP